MWKTCINKRMLKVKINIHTVILQRAINVFKVSVPIQLKIKL